MSGPLRMSGEQDGRGTMGPSLRHAGRLSRQAFSARRCTPGGCTSGSSMRSFVGVSLRRFSALNTLSLRTLGFRIQNRKLFQWVSSNSKATRSIEQTTFDRSEKSEAQTQRFLGLPPALLPPPIIPILLNSFHRLAL